MLLRPFRELDARTSLVDVTLLGWLASTSLLLLVHPSAADVARFVGHWGVIALVLALRRTLVATPAGERGVLRAVHALYPFGLLWLVYKELDVLQRKLGGAFLDGQVQGWEHALFGVSPAMWLSEALPWPGFSEGLHAAYMTFHLMLPVLALAVLARRDLRGFQAVMWTGYNTFLACYLLSLVMPVQGPRPLYPPLEPALRGLAWRASHAMCAGGAAEGAAFPSGHVAVSLVVAWCAWRWNRPLAGLFAGWAGLICLATLYGRYHYGVDVLAGLAVAGGMGWSGPRLFTALCRRFAPISPRDAGERACA